MQTIWKFPIDVMDMQAVEMPREAQLLAIQTQGEQVCLWARVDSSRPKERRTIIIYGTGHPVSSGDNLHYIGTFQLMGGALVFHAFELR